MAGRNLQWSWGVFWDGFWGGFGRFMAIFVGVFLVGSLFADTSDADFGSATFGLLFAVVCSAIYGYDKGEGAVREWRELQDEPPN